MLNRVVSLTEYVIAELFGLSHVNVPIVVPIGCNSLTELLLNTIFVGEISIPPTIVYVIAALAVNVKIYVVFPVAVTGVPANRSTLFALNVPVLTLAPPDISNEYVTVPVPLKLVTLNGYSLFPAVSANETLSVSVASMLFVIVRVLLTNDSGVGVGVRFAA